jgi:deoxyribose-phosphate aldolase
VWAVGFPTGAHTLVSKRVELLEIARLGGDAAEVVLTPHLVSEGHMGGLEEEMKALLATAPELEIRFAVEWLRLTQTARAKLLRLLRDFPPAVLRPFLGAGGSPPGPAEIKALRPLLPKRVRLKAVAADPRDAKTLLQAGADLVETERPESATAEEA